MKSDMPRPVHLLVLFRPIVYLALLDTDGMCYKVKTDLLSIMLLLSSCNFCNSFKDSIRTMFQSGLPLEVKNDVCACPSSIGSTGGLLIYKLHASLSVLQGMQTWFRRYNEALSCICYTPLYSQSVLHMS